MLKKRPIGRKLAKDRLKREGDARPFKEILQDILYEKKREERWKESKLGAQVDVGLRTKVGNECIDLNKKKQAHFIGLLGLQ